MQKQNWTIGIACYNEVGTIRQVYEQTQLVLQEIAADYEIIIVDDASDDGSSALIQHIASGDPKVKLIVHEQNKGIGGAIRSIYFNAVHENVTFIPGDNQFDVREFIPFSIIPSDTYISFYRTQNQTYSMFRNGLSYCNKLFNAQFLGLRLNDVNWVKVYKRNVIIHLDLVAQSSAIESEICSKLNLINQKPVQVQSICHPRTYGVSKGASLANMKKVVGELVFLYRALRKFKKSVKRGKAKFNKDGNFK